MEINDTHFKKWALDLMFELKKEVYPSLKQDFDMMNNYMTLINKFDKLSDTEPMSFPFSTPEVEFRKDDFTSTISQEEAFSNTKEIENGEIKVPKVVI